LDKENVGAATGTEKAAENFGEDETAK